MLAVLLSLQVVLAVAEEREVVLGQPLEQVACLAGLVGVHALGRLDGELVDDVGDLGVHLRPVLDRLAHVAQHPLDGVLDLTEVVAVGDPVDLDVHPRLTRELAPRPAELLGLVVDGADLAQLAGDVAADVEERVDDHVHVTALPRQLHRQGVDEEGHVVDDDLDHRAPRGGPSVLARRWRRHAHPSGALGPLAREPVVRGERAVEVGVGAVPDVLGRDVAVVGPDQVVDRLARRTTRVVARARQGDRPGQQLGQVLLTRRR